MYLGWLEDVKIQIVRNVKVHEAPGMRKACLPILGMRAGWQAGFFWPPNFPRPKNRSLQQPDQAPKK